MTQIHVSNDTVDPNQHEYTELHRIGSTTLKVCIDFYPHSIEYSDAVVSVLNLNREWTELGEFSVDRWYSAVKAVDDTDARIAGPFKVIVDFLLQVGCEALGLLPPSPAEAVEGNEA